MRTKNELPPDNAPDSSLCEQTRFALFEEKELSESQKEHISHCAFCQSFASETESMLAALSALEQKPLVRYGKGLADSVMDEIDVQSELFGKRSKKSLFFRHAGLVAACVVIAVMAGPTVYRMLNADKNSDSGMALYARDVLDMDADANESESDTVHREERFSYAPSYSIYDHVEPEDETENGATSYTNTCSDPPQTSFDDAQEEDEAHDKRLIISASLIAEDDETAVAKDEAPESEKSEALTNNKAPATTDSGKNAGKDDKADKGGKKADNKADSKASEKKESDKKSPSMEETATPPADTEAAPTPVEAANDTHEPNSSATGAEGSQTQPLLNSAIPSENAMQEAASTDTAELQEEQTGSSGGSSHQTTSGSGRGGGSSSGSSSAAVSSDKASSVSPEMSASNEAPAENGDATRANDATGSASGKESNLLTDAKDTPSSTNKETGNTNGSLTDTAYAAASSAFSGIYAVDASSAYSQLFDTTACVSFLTSDPSITIQVFLEQDAVSFAWTVSHDSKGNAQIFEVHAAEAE